MGEPTVYYLMLMALVGDLIRTDIPPVVLPIVTRPLDREESPGPSVLGTLSRWVKYDDLIRCFLLGMLREGGRERQRESSNVAKNNGHKCSPYG